MSSPERPGGPQITDTQPVPYFAVSRFRRERAALRTYTQLQDVLLQNECDLSTYRFLLNQISHVAVLGSRPAETLVSVIERLLAAGERTSVPPEVRQQLEARRAQATQLGLWVEGHYRPGRPLRPDNGKT